MNRPRRPEQRRYPVNPAAIQCPACRSVVHRVHVLGGHTVAFCEAKTRRVADKLMRCCLHIYVFVDDEGACFAVPIDQAQYEWLTMFAAVNARQPTPPDVLSHLGLSEAA